MSTCQWISPLDQLALEEGELHIWRAEIEYPRARMQSWMADLSPDEKERAQRFHFEKDRLVYVYGRTLLRRLLGKYTGQAPEQIEFLYTPFGKPYLKDSSQAPPVRFNLSNSGEIILVALAQGIEVGVDVEKMHPISDFDRIAARFFSPHENQALRSLPEATKLAAFFRCWTRKEAVIKACGEGLSMPLGQFDVSLVPGEPARLLRSPDARQWMLFDLDPAPGYAAAAAAAAASLRVSCFDGSLR